MCASAPASASHSACQAPAARSCSCSSDAGEHAGVSRREPSARARERRADRVALLRHRRGPSRPAAFRHLGDLGLRQQHEVERDLRGDTGGGRERGAELRDASPVRVPGQRRNLKVELPCVELEQRDAVVAEARERPGGSAELRREPFSGDLLEPYACLDDRGQPAGGLEAERRRHGVLQERPGDHRRLAVLACERRGRRRHAVGFGEHERERPPRDEHRGRVDDVLARRAAVHVPRRVVADRAGEGAHERLDGVADGAAFRQELLEVEALGVAGAGDLGRERAPERCRRSRRRSRAPALRRASLRARPGTTRRPVGRRGRKGRRTPTCRDRSGSRPTARVSGVIPTTGTASWIFDMACDIQHAMVVRGEVARGSVVPERDQPPRTVGPSAAADFLLPLVSVAAALAALGARLAGRADLADRPARDEHDDAGALVDAADRRVLEELRLHRARLGARPRDRDRARRPARDPARRERARRPRVPGADRVPAADPLGGADPAPLPHARPVAEERGLPGRVRRVLAAARADDLRRPRRRPAGDRHRPLLRRRPARAPLPDHAPERDAVHRDRAADLVDRLPDPRVHRRALHGHAGARPGDELRAVVRPERPAVRARDRDRVPRPRRALPDGRRWSGACSTGIRRSGRSVA